MIAKRLSAEKLRETTSASRQKLAADKAHREAARRKLKQSLTSFTGRAIQAAIARSLSVPLLEPREFGFDEALAEAGYRIVDSFRAIDNLQEAEQLCVDHLKNIDECAARPGVREILLRVLEKGQGRTFDRSELFRFLGSIHKDLKSSHTENKRDFLMKELLSIDKSRSEVLAQSEHLEDLWLHFVWYEKASGKVESLKRSLDLKDEEQAYRAAWDDCLAREDADWTDVLAPAGLLAWLASSSGQRFLNSVDRGMKIRSAGGESSLSLKRTSTEPTKWRIGEGAARHVQGPSMVTLTSLMLSQGFKCRRRADEIEICW